MRFFRVVCYISLILLIYVSASWGASNSSSFTVGTVLFTPADITRECWSQENVALLTSRMLMSNLMPKTEKLKAEDDSFITDIIEYFRLLLEVIRLNTNGKTKHIMLMAATDTIGGYMKHLVLPITKYSYYAGNVQYGSIIRLYQLYDELKNFLRTNGNGWSKPWKKAGKHIQAKAISIQTSALTNDPCKGLIYQKRCKIVSHDTNEKICRIDVPMPFFDSKSHPAAIAVPFRAFGLRNLESRVSAYIIVKYFVAVSKCMAVRSSTIEDDVQRFNSGIFSFVAAKIMPHLGDEKFYAAFGGVLRVLQTVSEISKAKGHAVGNINVMPEIVDREPPDIDEDEAAAVDKKSTDHQSKRNFIILLILFLVLMLMILCILYVCCRLRAGRTHHDKVAHDHENACMETTCPVLTEAHSAMYSEDSDSRATKTKIIYTHKQSTKPTKSLQIKASKKSTKSSKSSKFTKSTKSTGSHATTDPDIDDEDTDSRSVLSRTTSPSMLTGYTQPPRTSSPQGNAKPPGNESPIQRASPMSLKVEPVVVPRRVASPLRESSTQDMHSTTSTSTKAPNIGVHSMQQYYPPTFACHSSMTGKIKMNSSSEDYTSKEDVKRPYVFGYDFQTTSEGSTPRGDPSSDGEQDLGGNMSK